MKLNGSITSEYFIGQRNVFAIDPSYISKVSYKYLGFIASSNNKKKLGLSRVDIKSLFL